MSYFFSEVAKAFRIALFKLKAESQRTYLGFIWWIIQPLMDLLIFYLLFAVILKRGGDDYISFLFIGLVAWKWLSQSILCTSSSVIANKTLILSFPTPKYVYVFIDLFIQTAKFIPAFLICLVGYIYAHGAGFSYISIIAVLLTQFFFCLSCGLFVASIVPFFVDLQLLFPVLIRLLFYPSGILFDPKTLSEKMQFYIYLNPLVGMFQSYRDVMMHNKIPSLSLFIPIWLLSILFGSIGFLIFIKNDQNYAKMRF